MVDRSVWDALKQKAVGLFRKPPSVNEMGEASASTGEAPPVSGEEPVLELQTDPSNQNTALARVEIRAEIPLGTTLRFSITTGQDGQVTLGEKSLVVTEQTTVSTAQPQAGKTAPPSLPLPRATLPNLPAQTVLAWLSQNIAWVLGGAALLVSLALIAWRLEDFPIYFFGDEAVQVLFAETLIKNNFLAANPQGIPIYIEAAGNRWTPVLSMYFHAVTMLLFGKSIIVTRLTTGLVGMAGILAAGFALRDVFKSRFWWLAPIVAVAMPGWLLHVRTGFETVMAAGFYGLFILFYLLYRYRSPKYIFHALIFGAAVFYSYSNAQAIIAAAGMLLFFSDIKYHWENRAWLLKGSLLALVLLVPFILFRLREPGAIAEHLRTVNSFVAQDIPLQQKIVLYFQRYFYGLSPQYWFIPNTHDLARHRMVGMGQITTWMFPLFLIGLVLALVQIRESAFRAILIAALAAPVGAAVLEVTITRVLPFIVPAVMLIVLGFEWLTERFSSKAPAWLFSTIGLVIFSMAGITTLNTALTKGPLWVTDYGLYGMQFGAKQIFVDTLPKYLRDPNARIFMSSTWANGTDNFIRFFLSQPEQMRVQMSSINDYIDNLKTIGPDDYFVLTPSEYERALQSGRFEKVEVAEIINYPNDAPGFYIVQVQYAQGVEAIIAAEQEEKRKPVTGSVIIDGQEMQITYSRIDMGQPKDLFDGDFFTLMRGAEANPYFLEMVFPSPRSVTGLVLDLATMDYEITVSLYAPGAETPVTYTTRGEKITTDAHVEMAFENAPEKVERVTLSILNLLTGDFANIHIRELKLIP